MDSRGSAQTHGELRRSDAARGHELPRRNDAACGHGLPRRISATCGHGLPRRSDAARGHGVPRRSDTALGHELPRQSNAARECELPRQSDAARESLRLSEKMAKKYPRLCGDTYLILFSLSILPFRLSYSNHSGFSWLFGAFHGSDFFVPIGFQPFRFAMGF